DSVKYLDGLIDLINTNITNIDQHPPTSASSALIKPESNASDLELLINESHYLNII
ncbi:35221_t:CDS:2, partial [Gigaspora margarita]